MSKQMTINLLVEQKDFIENYQKEGKSFNTLKNYQQDLNSFNKFALEKFKVLELSELKIDHVKEYDSYLTLKNTKDNSRRRRIQTLRLFADHLMKRGILMENPVRKLVVSPKRLSPVAAASFSDVYTVYTDLKDKYQKTQGFEKVMVMRNLMIFYMIYEAGLKVSDLENLKFKHILLSGPKPRVLVEHPKRDPMSVPLPESFVRYHEEYKNLLTQKNMSTETNEHYLFNANHYAFLGMGLSARGIELLFKELSKKASTPMTPKSLRQSCIVRWINNLETDESIRDWMGVMPNYSMQMYREYKAQKPEASQFISLNWETLWMNN